MKKKKYDNHIMKYSKHTNTRPHSTSLSKNIPINKPQNESNVIPIIDLLKCPICKKICLININRDQILFSFECNNSHNKNYQKSNTFQQEEKSISDLNISHEEADKLKRQYGLALKSFIDNDNNIVLNTCKDPGEKNKTIKSSDLIEIIEARIEEIFSLVNKDIISHGIKGNINNVVLTGEGIVNINKSDMAGKIILNIPVKISTGRLISTIKSTYRTSYALVRYIAARPYAKSVSSSIDTRDDKSVLKTVLEKVRDFFYS